MKEPSSREQSTRGRFVKVQPIEERLLIVDDEVDMLEGLRRVLTYDLQGIEIVTTAKPREALDWVRKGPVDVVLLDIRMPEMDGLKLLGELLKVDRSLTVIMMTAYGSIETAVQAIKSGAYDFITKPLEKEPLLRVIRKGFERNRLLRENLQLRQRMCERGGLEGFVGQSLPMRRLYDQLQSIARTNYTVLIRGESGTGKELAGRAIHALSARRNRPFVTVNCPAIPEHLLESELFGHKKGAFTGADADLVGLFDEADGGSLLLDEVADIPVNIQTKLLRVLQEREIKPLGMNKTHTVDVRIIASTNQNIEEKISERSFREDLYYRLNVVTIRTPSLVEIREDIPLLVNHFARVACRELKIAQKHFSTKALEECMCYSWPGNVRELQNFVRRVVMFCPDNHIRPEDLQMAGKTYVAEIVDREPEGELEGTAAAGLEPYREAKERMLKKFTLEYVSELLQKTGGNVTRAAELSGMRRSALQKIMRRLDFKGTP